MALIGYGRVSTTDQDTAIQEKALTDAGCTVIRLEKKSGTSTNGREALKNVLDFLRSGDTLVVTRLDRLARSLEDLLGIVRVIHEKGASLRVIEQPIDTSNSAGKLFLQMLGAFAEFETNLRKERQLEGIAKAKASGVYKGRKPSIDIDRVRSLHAAGKGATEIAKALGIDRTSVYRVLED